MEASRASHTYDLPSSNETNSGICEQRATERAGKLCGADFSTMKIHQQYRVYHKHETAAHTLFTFAPTCIVFH